MDKFVKMTELHVPESFHLIPNFHISEKIK